MADARYSIGIDLGTTNSALAFASLQGDAPTEIMLVPQWVSLTTQADEATLPSFLYLPEDAVAHALQGPDTRAGQWVVGHLARARMAETPGRVVHSAKSWLGHHAADRSAPFLPWGSADLSAEQKISPVRASALILNYLRGSWDRRFAAAGLAFDDQIVTITVPASFDVAAQRLTMAAAEEAGFPAGVRLLEEPQAAFYAWLDNQDAARALWRRLEERDPGPRHVLVVDIGGGTSDFSLFELRPDARNPIPDVRRIAVSDHILLGGDNIDLALAHLAESNLGGGRGQLSGGQWDRLVATCRDLKETVLSAEGPSDERFAVAVPGRGSAMIAGSQATTISREQIEKLLLDGFFPLCDAAARPHRMQGALQEWGLPYAADSAVTRHLAGFLRDRPRVDAVLFNGGSVDPALVRRRVQEQIAAWQDGHAPIVLENAEPALAVARGAARYGALVHRHARQIGGGAPQAMFLEVQSSADAETAHPVLVCVLPRGAAPEQPFEIADPPLELVTDRPVRFQAFSSARHRGGRAGEIVERGDGEFHALPPLQTTIRLGEAAGPRTTPTLPVRLVAKMNALGLLQISVVSADPAIAQSWPLDFDLRARGAANSAAAADGAGVVDPNATPAAIEAARVRIGDLFGRSGKPAGKPTIGALFKGLEQTLGAPRNSWNGPLLRALWPALEERFDGRGLSVEHEETWLILAGFLLRPGFGVVRDDVRMDAVWRVHEAGGRFPGRRIKVQEYILWRRLAGGLNRERQLALVNGEIDRIRSAKAPPELVRMASALELIPLDIKAELVERFIETAVTLVRAKGHAAPYLSALGLLLNRAPFYAGPETVVPPEFVEHAYAEFRGLDWSEPDLHELQTLFLRAARVVGDRGLDVPKPLRNLIAGKLEKSGVPAQRTAKIKDFMPVGRSDRATLYDEALPPGLVFGGAADAAAS